MRAQHKDMWIYHMQEEASHIDHGAGVVKRSFHVKSRPPLWRTRLCAMCGPRHQSENVTERRMDGKGRRGWWMDGWRPCPRPWERLARKLMHEHDAPSWGRPEHGRNMHAFSFLSFLVWVCVLGGGEVYPSFEAMCYRLESACAVPTPCIHS